MSTVAHLPADQALAACILIATSPVATAWLVFEGIRSVVLAVRGR